MRIKIGSRKSDLARIQAYSVGDQLAKLNPKIEIEYDFRESLGDINQSDPLWQMPAQGVFTQDFYEGLCEGRWDIVVHSWKDLPVEERDGTEIVATLPRADLRDLLICPIEIADKLSLRKEIRVLSSSPRRQFNLGFFLKTALPGKDLQVEFKDIRGNVQTRIRKLLDGEGDALIVAKAAIDRLLMATRPEFLETKEFIQSAMEQCRWMVLPISANPTAAAQGALAIEVARGREDILPLLQKLNCTRTFAAVKNERKLHKSFGGGCHQKIGINYQEHSEGTVISLRGLSESGETLNRFQLVSTPSEVDAGQLSHAHDKTSVKSFWPNSSRKEQLFDREEIAWEEVKTEINLGEESSPLLLTRKESLPKDLSIPNGQILWTSGIRTWQSLAAEGIWVNGTLDSLGESQIPNSFAWIQGGESLNWQKLSHSSAPSSDRVRNIPTYHLRSKTQIDFDLSQYQRFFWMSGTQFSEAVRRWPEIRNRSHASGPGNTLEHLRQELGDSAKIELFLSLTEWMKFHQQPKKDES